MSKFTRAHRAVAALATTAVLAAGLLTATAASASNRALDKKMSAVITQVHEDANYKPIPLYGKADNSWFFDQCDALFTGKITKEQFVSEGAQKYPGYDASFKQFADLLMAP